MSGNVGAASGVFDRCRALGAQSEVSLADLEALARATDAREALRHAVPDPARPYGRRVLFANGQMEAMIASWTRAVPCAPHDHGGSEGVVRVLSGRLHHRLWRVAGGRLRLAAEEEKSAGDLLACGPHLVHSMVDAGGDEPLVTLHLYHGPIRHMVVYDQARERTVLVDGGCGAWIPLDRPDLVLRAADGFLSPEAVPLPEAAC